ncbi:rac gtpase [Pelomyxa schiedti]|nr:rac gtpase [Pelomyxa schiedti]
MQAITVVAIGDSEVGKTSLLFAALSNKLVTGHYTQRMFDSDPVSVNYASKIYSLTVHDVPGSMNPGWRNVYFKGAAAFLICFSVVNPESWAKVRTEYCPEIAHYCPGIPFIIVGTHRDLRSDKQTIKRLLLNGVSTITFQVGRELAKKVCAAGYIEISSLSGEHVPDLLANIIRVASPAMPGPEKSKASSFFSLGRLLNFVGDRFSPSQERALLNLQWTPLFSTSNGVARYGHIQAHFGTIVYTVGGVLEPIEPEILRYDISERRWLQPLPLVVTASELSTTLSGKTIQEMAFSASVFTGNFLFIFGGRSNNFSNSLYCFNMKTGEIALLPSEGSPTPRYGASMILFGKLLFVFGGYDNSGSVSDDLGCYDISTNHWKPIVKSLILCNTVNVLYDY